MFDFNDCSPNWVKLHVHTVKREVQMGDSMAHKSFINPSNVNVSSTEHLFHLRIYKSV